MSNDPFEMIRTIDRLVHEPARLSILTALDACRSADFMYLQTLTGFSRGNLSLHLGKLEAAGLIAIEKMFRGKTPVTVVHLTAEGRIAFRTYWRRLEKTRREARKWARTRSIVAH